MDRLLAMRLFTRVVELRSFTRAADEIGLTRAAATQGVQQLEARLGTRLLSRTTRQVSPTVDGTAYYQRCVAILGDIDEAEEAFSQSAAHPRGRIRVDLTASLCRLVLLPALPDFCARFADISFELSVGGRPIDLVGEGVDCVLRFGELRDSTLVARRLALLPQVNCASPAYLAAHGTPRTPADLAGHQAVDYFSVTGGRVMPFELLVDGTLQRPRLASRVAVNSGDAYVAACEAGLGLGQVPRYQVARQLADGRLVELLAGCPPPPLPLTVLYAQGRQLAPRVRVFIDWLAERFANAAAW